MLITKAPNRTSNPYSHYITAPLIINPGAHKLTSPRRLILAIAIKNTIKNKEDTF
jgi:hypothetical protein